MHPLVFLAIATFVLGALSYGVTLMPLEPQPKQIAHFGIVIGYLIFLANHFGLV